jgi:hypothetical protein
MRGSAVAKRSEPTQNIEPVRRDEAERRQLTAMFCDLVASMTHLKGCAPGILYATHIHEGGAPWLSQRIACGATRREKVDPMITKAIIAGRLIPQPDPLYRNVVSRRSAAFRSSVSRPSTNHANTGSSSVRASPRRP